MRIMRARSPIYLVVLGASATVAAAQSTSADSAKSTPVRPATCVAGLKQFATTAEVPRPYEVLKPNIQFTQVDPANFRRFMLGEFARAGATGFVSPTTSDPLSFVAIPVYVPADSARTAATCRDSSTAARPPDGSHDSRAK